MSGKFTPEQKYEIIMESLNSNITTAELCRKHGVAPVNFRKWRVKFLEGGKRALGESNSGNDYEREIDDLKKIIGEQSLVINELKKISGGRRR
jgi:transposase-like protein